MQLSTQKPSGSETDDPRDGPNPPPPFFEPCWRTSARTQSPSPTTGRPTSPFAAEYIDHKVINHSAGIYVEGSTHTNTIEGFFGNLKTGMRGTYKKVSPSLFAVLP